MVDLAQLPGEQTIYLFDIVASLCAGFNEHDIEFLSSLLALLRGDLSAQRGTDGRTDRYGKKCEDTGGKGERGRKRRNCLGDIKEVSSVKKKTQRGREKWLFGRVKTKRDRRWKQPGLSPGVPVGRFSAPTCLTL